MNIHLLIIEDDDSLNQMLAMHFEDKGYKVSRALDCATGRKILEQSAADLIFLDQPFVFGLDSQLVGTQRRCKVGDLIEVGGQPLPAVFDCRIKLLPPIPMDVLGVKLADLGKSK